MHKIKLLYLYIALLSSVLCFADGFDEYGGGYGMSTTGYDSYGGHYADPSYIGNGIFITPAYAYSVPGTPNGGYYNPYIVQNPYGGNYTTYTYTSSYTVGNSPDTWSSVGHLSPSEAASVTIGPNDLLVPWYNTSQGQWYTIYRDFQPGYPVLTANQTTVYLAEVNNFIYNNYGPNVYYSYNVYNVSTGTYFYAYYQSTATGTTPPTPGTSPYVSGSNSTYPVVTYGPIPKIPNVGNLNAGPGSPFQTAYSLYNNSTLTLSQASLVIREYIDKVIPEAPGGRKSYIENVISKIANGLPADKRVFAESILVMFMQINDQTLTANDLLPLVSAFHGKPMPFSTDLVTFSQQIATIAKNESNIADRNNLINIMLVMKNGNYDVQGLDENFNTAINAYVDLNTIGMDPTSPLMLHIWIEAQVLKANHPTWSTWKIYWEASKVYLHLALDVIGLVPVAGEVADLANGVLYTIEGDAVNASLSYVSAVPVVGWVSAGTKMGLKVINVASDVTSKVKLIWKIEGNIIKFGNRSQLRKVLQLAVGDSRQAHHIIPWAKAEHQVIQRAAKSGSAFHMNEALNGIAVAAWRNQPNHNIYDAKVLQKLDAILATNPNPQQAYNKVQILVNNIRAAIVNNPNTHLNDLIF